MTQVHHNIFHKQTAAVIYRLWFLSCWPSCPIPWTKKVLCYIKKWLTTVKMSLWWRKTFFYFMKSRSVPLNSLELLGSCTPAHTLTCLLHPRGHRPGWACPKHLHREASEEPSWTDTWTTTAGSSWRGGDVALPEAPPWCPSSSTYLWSWA